MTTICRGVKNCNALNIKRGEDDWIGLAPPALQTDPVFWTFSSPEYGIRAAAKILRTYDRRGIDTVEQIVSSWAPAEGSDHNPTAAYITTVAKTLGVDRRQRLDLRKQAVVAAILKAMIRVECNQWVYPDGVVEQGVALAFPNQQQQQNIA